MDPSAQHASAALLRELAEDGVITLQQSAALQTLLRRHVPWRVWTERLLLIVGTGLLLAGVVFFFAWNWHALLPWQKFGLIETALVLCAIGAAWRKLETLGGRLFLTAACVMVGVFLAVFGQIYQTGADAFELFLGWAALIFPWVLLGRFGALWMLWLLLLNAALCLSWQQVDFWAKVGAHDWTNFAIVVALLNALALAARESGARRYDWLREPALRGTPLALVFLPLTIANIWFIAGTRWREGSVEPAVAFIVAAGLAYWVYRKIWPDLFCLAGVVLSLSILVVTLLGRALLVGSHDSAAFLLVAVLTLAVFGGAVAWLRVERRAIEAGRVQP
jgi:uncharacterized membrane protein